MPAVLPAVQAEGAVIEHLGDFRGEPEPAGPDQVENLLPDRRGGGLRALGPGHRAGEPAELGAEGAIRNFFGVTI